ncbi:hypothetical protein [Paenibacillus crassostreae]|uniref:Uncharacterized protein n=1 Tax=Paenibacillus crassostreae TaxID=1763538 RepID=A0A167C5N4_9BACL|nr:hypothetical protein [Paenibacillus crassostreae]AOZ91618.1 hypothetical protein LPB68_04895 [Paenibacillus crassostreae]OAB72808.1 hypothetical protein PNBC_15355 [Paenibacillus crassostreae]
MEQYVGRRLYYDKSTGEIIIDTRERIGYEVEATIESDFDRYTLLKERTIDSVGVIELEYGQYSEDFEQATRCKINPETLKLEFSYPDPNNPVPEVPIYRKPLTEEVELLKSADLDNKEAITTLYEMMLSGMEM